MDKNKFNFTYSAPTKTEREQIEDIRKDYLPKSDSVTKLDRLKKLDGFVKNTPMIIALTIGIVGILIFGLGLTMILEWNQMVWGIIISTISLVPMGFAYPVFWRVKTRLTAKHKDEILSLSEELLNGKD